MVKQGDISAVVVIQGLYRVADIIADRAYAAYMKNRGNRRKQRDNSFAPNPSNACIFNRAESRQICIELTDK